MMQLKQSSAAQPLPFLLIDSTDHINGKIGASPTVTIRKNNTNGTGAFISPVGTVREIGNGWYQVDGSVIDTNTLGPLMLHATAGGADPADAEYQVVGFNPLATNNSITIEDNDIDVE